MLQHLHQSFRFLIFHAFFQILPLLFHPNDKKAEIKDNLLIFIPFSQGFFLHITEGWSLHAIVFFISISRGIFLQISSLFGENY